MFGKDVVKLKGLRCGAVGVLWRCLKKREAAGDLLVVPIDGFLTSQICNSCKSRTMVKHPDVTGNSVLVCTTCNTLRQRDISASKNMMFISLSVWDGHGIPEVFRRNNL
ncbi:hypothetical protein BD408DRAFT_416480 [Parasitella parasitica]|nr:hypothetical protein BD408DRAFT_416480 [Parasitella parasitica]